MFLEDINNLLNSGEVPNIFGADEKEDICEKMREFDKQRDKSIQVRFFINFYSYKWFQTNCGSSYVVHISVHLDYSMETLVSPFIYY
jgi:hypothetical protein